MILKRRRKVFCIGFNKTGTTSLAAALRKLGLKVGDQTRGELLIEDWARRDFRRIIDLCRTADAFQDIPFSLDHTYTVLDHVFPGSKFILSLRRDGDEWFDSLTRFHSQLISVGRLPTADDLRAFSYNGKGWIWRAHQLVHRVDETNLYLRSHYVPQYEAHNRQVLDYFRNRPDDLLVLNVGERNAMELICRFLTIKYADQQMPKLNCSRKAA